MKSRLIPSVLTGLFILTCFAPAPVIQSPTKAEVKIHYTKIEERITRVMERSCSRRPQPAEVRQHKPSD